MGETEGADDNEVLLTREDIVLLREHPKFKKFLKWVNYELDKARKDVDLIEPSGLRELQGRIRAYKLIIYNFGEEL